MSVELEVGHDGVLSITRGRKDSFWIDVEELEAFLVQDHRAAIESARENRKQNIAAQIADLQAELVALNKGKT